MALTLTFPHIGPAYLTASLALRSLGIPHVVPPANTAETLKKGETVSPEEMCLPFKYMAGNLIQAYEAGARQVIMPATMGPCRLGEYGELLKQVLERAGYKMEWILLDTPKAIGMREWLRRMTKAACGTKVKWPEAAAVLAQSVRLAKGIDEVEAGLKQQAGLAVEPRECVRLLRNFRQELSRQSSMGQALSLLRRYKQKAKAIPVEHGAKPVKILVTGEIYTSIESAANQELEERLMLLGCQVRRPVTISWWLRHTVMSSLPGAAIGARKREERYLPYSIGGYARETVREIGKAPEDGIIKVMPSGCMPEIVAKAASGRIEEEQGKKVLHLIFGEMQAGAGYETRVEAFIDMLERRKCVFSGN